MISDTYNEKNSINNATKKVEKVLEVNMINKGFTLIELLAVILILGIISLISVPVVSNIIDSSEKGSAESSMMGYVDAIEKKAMLAQITSKDIISAGAHTAQELATLNIKVKGEYPDDASIFIIDNEGRVTEGWATYRDGKYKVYYDGTYAVADKDNYLDKSGELHNSIPEPGTIDEDKGIVVYAADAITKMIDGVADYKSLNRVTFLRYTFTNSEISKTEVCEIIGEETGKLFCLGKESIDNFDALSEQFGTSSCKVGNGYDYDNGFSCNDWFTRADVEYDTRANLEYDVTPFYGSIITTIQIEDKMGEESCGMYWNSKGTGAYCTGEFE